MMGLLPTGLGPGDAPGPAKVSLFYSLRADRLDAWREAGLDAWKREVRALAPRAEPVIDQIRSLDQVLFARYHDVSMYPWTTDRVDYLGDAAIDLTPLRAIDVPPGIDLIFEPGRYLTADAGWYAATVLDIKTTHGRTFAVLRGGTHHFRLPAAWGYDHPFTVIAVDDWPHPYPRPAATDTPVDAVGELCTPRDVLCRARPVETVRAGDLLVFARTGAYGWDISHHDFLRHDPPAFVIV